MIAGGNATVYVLDMDRAIRFCTEVLGLKLTNRFAGHWATVQAERSLVIGRHPVPANHPRPGTKGATEEDPDGNPIYVGDGEILRAEDRDAVAVAAGVR